MYYNDVKMSGINFILETIVTAWDMLSHICEKYAITHALTLCFNIKSNLL